MRVGGSVGGSVEGNIGERKGWIKIENREVAENLEKLGHLPPTQPVR